MPAMDGGRRLRGRALDIRRWRVAWTSDLNGMLPVDAEVARVAEEATRVFRSLGARVVDYVPDMYGTTESPLHLGLATDRIIVALATGGHEIERERVATSDHLPVMTPFPRLNDFAFGVALFLRHVVKDDGAERIEEHLAAIALHLHLAHAHARARIMRQQLPQREVLLERDRSELMSPRTHAQQASRADRPGRSASSSRRWRPAA